MRTLVFSLAAITLLSVSASAQIRDRIERCSKERTNQRVDRKADNKIDNGAVSGPDAREAICKKADNGEKIATLVDQITMNSAEIIATEGFTFVTAVKVKQAPSKSAKISH